jgi:hypothetical protein
MVRPFQIANKIISFKNLNSFLSGIFLNAFSAAWIALAGGDYYATIALYASSK